MNLPINPKTATTFRDYFNDNRNDAIDECDDDDIKNARNDITYMAENILDNIDTSKKMTSTSLNLKDLINRYNKFIKNTPIVYDWLSGHEKIKKLPNNYRTLLSKLIIHDEKLKRMCDEKMKQPPQHPLKPLLKYFNELKLHTIHFYLPVYVLLKLLRHHDLIIGSKKHESQHFVNPNNVIHISSYKNLNKQKETKLLTNFFNFITTNFTKIIIPNKKSLNQSVSLIDSTILKPTDKDMEQIDEYIEKIESLLKYFKSYDAPKTLSSEKTGVTDDEKKTYNNIRNHFEFKHNTPPPGRTSGPPPFALGEYFNLALVAPRINKQADNLKVYDFKKYINAIHKKLKGSIQTNYRIPPPPPPNTNYTIKPPPPPNRDNTTTQLDPVGVPMISFDDLKEKVKLQERSKATKTRWSGNTRMKNFEDDNWNNTVRRRDMTSTYGTGGGNKTKKRKQNKKTKRKGRKNHNKQRKHKTRYKKRNNKKRTRKTK
jgi:hypothetical protein